MTATYEAIATTTLGSTATSVTFSNIPGTFTDLILVTNQATSGTPTQFGCTWRANSDSGNNYSSTYLYGTGSSAASGRASNSVAAGYGFESYSSGTYVNIIHFNNYSNSTTFKTSISRSSSAAASNLVGAWVGLWRSTAAITSIQLLSTDYGSGSTPFVSGSTFTLYGIKAE